jgi:hypothetical protein
MSIQGEEGSTANQINSSQSNHELNKQGGGTMSKTGHHLELSPPAVNIRQGGGGGAGGAADSKVASP